MSSNDFSPPFNQELAELRVAGFAALEPEPFRLGRGSSGMKTYRIRHWAAEPVLGAGWDDPVWQAAPILEVSQFLPQSSSHRPQTLGRLIASATGLHGIYRVRDRYVRCRRTQYFAEVWKDSCVEVFLEPLPGRGYFNFEFNCGGAHLCCHITDATLVSGWFKCATNIPPERGTQVRVRGSLPPLVDPECPDPIDWTLQYFIPFSLLESYVGPLGVSSGACWRGNFFKCAEEVSHPHWAAWSAVDEFNFHLPRCFGSLVFD